MARIIPGVEVTVVKEVVPKQLAPSGVLGVVGIIESDTTEVIRASSFSTFLQKCGPSSLYSMPDAVDALNNGVFELVIVPIQNQGTAASGTNGKLSFTARSKGPWPNSRFSIESEVRMKADEPEALTLKVIDGTTGDAVETFRNLVLDPSSANYVEKVVNEKSGITTAAVDMTVPARTLIVIPEAGLTLYTVDTVNVITLKKKTGATEEYKIRIQIEADTYKVTIKDASDDTDLIVEEGIADTPALIQFLRDWVDGDDYKDHVEMIVDFSPFYPSEGSTAFAGGVDAAGSAYSNALVELEDEPDVDMVLAAIQDTTDKAKYTAVYDSIIAHCNNMSDDCKGRIGFGHVTIENNMNSYVDSANTIGAPLVSDRFVLMAPHGTAGAVAGMVGNLKYYQSPTFKAITGKPKLSARLTTELQRGLLKKNYAPIAVLEGRGTVVVKGITTDGDQISVRRVADRAVRMVKSIGDEFIGRLNTDDGRTALKQKITEGLLQMEKVNAIVPHAENGSPAFMIDVYSSGADFAMGIVRVDMAVRPVRAIDYIYATITVQV